MNTNTLRVGFGAALIAVLIAAAAYVFWPGESDASGPETNVVDAPIESVEVVTLKSNPAQYEVRIVSGLPSGCAKYDATEVTGRDGDVVTIRVTNTMPAGDTVCTMIYGTHESSVNIGSDFETGKTYTVDVNGTKVEFTAS